MIKRLDTIRVPYATMHCMQNGMFSLNNGLIANDQKTDDNFITQSYQDEFEEEPPQIRGDFHIPQNNKVNIMPVPPSISGAEAGEPSLKNAETMPQKDRPKLYKGKSMFSKEMKTQNMTQSSAEKNPGLTAVDVGDGMGIFAFDI